MNCKYCEYPKGSPCQIDWSGQVYCQNCTEIILPRIGIECISEVINQEGYHIFRFVIPLVCDCGSPLKQLLVRCQDSILHLWAEEQNEKGRLVDLLLASFEEKTPEELQAACAKMLKRGGEFGLFARLMMGEFGLDEFGKRLDRANE